MSDGPEPTPNPTPEPTPNPTPEPTPNPTPEPTPNPTPEPTPNPTPEPTPAPMGAPEAYEGFNLPEGVKLEGEALERVHAWAKEHNLSQAQAQAVLEETHKVFENAHQAAEQNAQESRAEQADKWIEEIKADATLGGANFDNTVKMANAAVKGLGKLVAMNDENGSPVMGEDGKPKQMNDLAAVLRDTGAGNHPVVVRVLSDLGKLMQEGGYIGGGQNSRNTPTAQRMFSKSNMNP